MMDRLVITMTWALRAKAKRKTSLVTKIGMQEAEVDLTMLPHWADTKMRTRAIQVRPEESVWRLPETCTRRLTQEDKAESLLWR